MLTNKQVRMLQLLDEQVKSCSKCGLNINGTSIPYWNRRSKYAIIGESPGYAEIRKGTPFVGKAGKVLTDILDEMGFDPLDFLILNSVQCRTSSGVRNDKPTYDQLNFCQDYIRKYIKIVDPEKILCLGNFSKYIFTGGTTGVLSFRGKWNEFKVDLNSRLYDVLITIHPAYCIYNEVEGMDMLRQDIQDFKDKKIERLNEWFLTEEDFLI